MPRIDLDSLLELEEIAKPAPWKLEYGYDAIFINDDFMTSDDMNFIEAMRNSIKELCTELKSARKILMLARAYKASNLLVDRDHFFDSLENYDKESRG